jgi:hypothetical protein
MNSSNWRQNSRRLVGEQHRACCLPHLFSHWLLSIAFRILRTLSPGTSQRTRQRTRSACIYHTSYSLPSCCSCWLFAVKLHFALKEFITRRAESLHASRATRVWRCFTARSTSDKPHAALSLVALISMAPIATEVFSPPARHRDYFRNHSQQQEGLIFSFISYQPNTPSMLMRSRQTCITLIIQVSLCALMY